MRRLTAREVIPLTPLYQAFGPLYQAYNTKTGKFEEISMDERNAIYLCILNTMLIIIVVLAITL